MLCVANPFHSFGILNILFKMFSFRCCCYKMNDQFSTKTCMKQKTKSRTTASMLKYTICVRSFPVLLFFPFLLCFLHSTCSQIIIIPTFTHKNLRRLFPAKNVRCVKISIPCRLFCSYFCFYFNTLRIPIGSSASVVIVVVVVVFSRLKLICEVNWYFSPESYSETIR